MFFAMYCKIYDTSKRVTLTRFKIGETPPIAEKNPKSTVIYKLCICMILGEMCLRNLKRVYHSKAATFLDRGDEIEETLLARRQIHEYPVYY